MDIVTVRTDRQMDNVPDGTSDEENEALDPRIQIELDHLNLASTEINRLENELDEARSKYRSIISEMSNRMEAILHDRKRSIQKSREYYKLIGEAKIAQAEALKAARQFQTATTVYKAAKETVALAECRLIEEADSTAAQLTSAWQEMLNHAISKVTVAEKEKTKSEHEHKRRAAKFAELETRIQVLEKKFSKSIKKSRPYFELKAELDIKLMQQKQNVNDLQAAIKSTKRKYTETLRRLEKISEEIHQSRHERFWSKIPRMPGVGAETDSVASSLSEFGKESLGYESDLESQPDSDSLEKSDLDLQLQLELGGCSITDKLRKTQTNNDDTSVGMPDEVFEPETIPNETLDQINNNDPNGGAVSMATGDSRDIVKISDSVSKEQVIEKDSYSLNNRQAKEEEGDNSATCDIGVLSGDLGNNQMNKNDEVGSECENHVKPPKMMEMDKKETCDDDDDDDDDDDQSESFESCHEDQGISRTETKVSNRPEQTNEPPMKGTAELQAQGSPVEETTHTLCDENALADMASIKRPSLSGAED